MKVSRFVPQVYYKESRDFSYIGRLYEIVFNYLKTGVDLVSSNPLDNDVSTSIIDLLATTLGFESKHEYTIKDLVAICSAFSYMLKKKGTLESIETCVRALFHTQNIQSRVRVEVNVPYSSNVMIYIPTILDDIVLLEDVFDYILPTGMTYTFNYGGWSEESSSEEQIGLVSNDVRTYLMSDSYIAQVSNNGVGGMVGENVDEDLFIINSAQKNRSMTFTEVIQGDLITQLDTPINVEVNGTTVSFDEVEYAEQYEILIDGNNIGAQDAIRNLQTCDEEDLTTCDSEILTV